MYNSILSIAPSSVDRQTIWAGTDDGQLHLTRDGGNTWMNLTKRVNDMPQEALFAYQKAVDQEVFRLAFLLTELDEKTEQLEKTLRYLEELNRESLANVLQSIEAMLVKIRTTRALGQTPRPHDRQVGAWQSYEVTAYSKTADAQRKAKARVTRPSSQDWETLEQAKLLINAFQQEVDLFKRESWAPFVAEMNQKGLLLGLE